MSVSPPRPRDPFDEDYWRKLGAEQGRRNEPRTPSGPAPVRTALASALSAELCEERLALLEALDALNKRRTNVKRRLHEVHYQAAADPRQASAVSMMMEKDRELAAERTSVCDQYLQVVETLTQRAHVCDAVWRAENERHRDRRLSVEPTELDIPTVILEIPPDPFE